MKKLAITMGDPGGVGPEIIVKALNSPEVKNLCVPIVIGDVSVIEKALKLCKSPLSLRIIRSPEEAITTKGLINIIHVVPPAPPFPHSGGFAEAKQKWGKEKSKVETFKKNKPTTEGGGACVGYIRKAAEFALSKQVAGMVTAPISKEALKMAGLKWPGHTEMLADLAKTRDYAMMLVGGPLKVILVTIHTALKNVPDLITRQRIVKTLRLAQRACDMLRIKKPKIAVAGLNPHAGEAGIFGDEEIRKIIPAIRQAMNEGIPVSGPYPPDTIFHKAYKGEVDIIVCMYHDQGLIPLKMIAFDKGVNVTVGLPFIRTSPDHGTAYDIAWKGKANPSSMIEAIKVAINLRHG
jgi:4-hydroxythreonine-4-phosphate dehydrogenase